MDQQKAFIWPGGSQWQVRITSNEGHGVTSVDNKYLQKNASGDLVPTVVGANYLAEAVTNTEGNVYSFYGKLDPATIAAAMARLSRFGGDMRELLLKEFAGNAGHEEDLLRRVLTQFGDDSVMQLGTVPVVVENASNWLTKQLEWGRFAAYLEQSTRYIYYDEKRNNRYRYYVPDHLPEDLLNEYRTTMDTVFDNYALVVRKMMEYFQENDSTPEEERDASWRIAMRGKACDAARGLLPVATTSTVGIVGSAQAIDNLIMHLLSQELPEARQAGREILAEVRKKHAIFFERTDMANRGAAVVDHKRQTRHRVRSLAKKLVPTGEDQQAPVQATLLDYAPRDEFELLPHMLYSHTNQSFTDLQRTIGK